MSKLKAPRGCPDWLPEQFEKADFILSQAKDWAETYGFKGYTTPVFEHAEVFTKSLGESSDIITKEMYSLSDKNGEVFVLRPEATAPLVRLFIANKLQRSLPLKMFTYGPMFRYERPQKGRQRQFHQIGIEHLGAPNDLYTHFETLSFGWNFIKSLKIKSPLKIMINGLGSSEERQSFKLSLVSYLKPLKDKLSEDSQKRLEQNPLRILDSKSEADQEILKNAPLITDFIKKESLEKTTALIDTLNQEGITAELNPLLVRGLDYYNDLVFEIIAESDLGAQNTVLAGGRYDGLIESMGGSKTSAIGWGAGLERLMILSDFTGYTKKRLGLIALNLEESDLIKISHQIRAKALPVYIPTTGNFSKKMQKAEKNKCSHALIIGEEELKTGLWSLKDFKTGQQVQMKSEDFLRNFSF